MLTENDLQLLRGKNYAQFVTLNPDGTPQATPIWIDADDEGNVVVNTAIGRRKDRNVRRDPRVAVSLFPSDDPLTYLSINGTVVRRVDGVSDLALLMHVARPLQHHVRDDIGGLAQDGGRAQPVALGLHGPACDLLLE